MTREGKLFFNEDGTQQYYDPLPGRITADHLDRIVDALAHTHNRVFILCVNGKYAYYPSRVWEVATEILRRGDRTGERGTENSGQADDPWFQRLAANMQALFDQGIDPPGHLFARARRQGMKAWASVRMNDGHARGQPNHPLNSRFYREHPDYWTIGNTLGNAWDYALEPVRAHFMALITEALDRYDIDGLELDWNRSPNHFRDGQFDAGRAVLTRWMGEVRKVVEAASSHRQRHITLAVRVPARPEVARGIGLDAVAWARRELVDHLIVGPYKGTTDFDVPVERWKRLVKGTGVAVTVSLEHVASFFPGCPNRWSSRWGTTREQLRGAAIAALHRGSDGVYLFNHMGRPTDDFELLCELGSLKPLARKGRDYLVTWVSPEIPGKPIAPPLPREVAPGGRATFRIYIGPKPSCGALGTVFLTFGGECRSSYPEIEVTVNRRRTEPRIAEPTSPVLPGHARAPFLVGAKSFTEGYAAIAVRNTGSAAVEIKGVELTMRFPGG